MTYKTVYTMIRMQACADLEEEQGLLKEGIVGLHSTC